MQKLDQQANSVYNNDKHYNKMSMIVSLIDKENIPNYSGKNISVAGKSFPFNVEFAGFEVFDISLESTIRKTMNKDFWKFIETKNAKDRKIQLKKEEEEKQKAVDAMASKVFSVTQGKYVDVPPIHPVDPIIDVLEKLNGETVKELNTEKYGEDGLKPKFEMGEKVQDVQYGQDIINAEKELEEQVKREKETKVNANVKVSAPKKRRTRKKK